MDELTAKNVGLKDEFKNLEKKYKKIKEEQASMRDQLKLFQSEYSLHFMISHKVLSHYTDFESIMLIDVYAYISGEREKRASAEMKAKNLEKKMEMYQSVKIAIDGTLPGKH